jgi:hypothetical protein
MGKNEEKIRPSQPQHDSPVGHPLKKERGGDVERGKPIDTDRPERD